MPVMNIVLGYQLYVGVLEIVVFMLGAAVLGFFIHFFISSRRSMPTENTTWGMEPPVLADAAIKDNEEWRIKYYEEVESQKELLKITQQDLDEVRENEELMNIEVEELRKEIKRLEQSGAQAGQPVQLQLPAESAHSGEEYLTRLKSAQESLAEHHYYISRLLEQVDHLKESEQRYMDTTNTNERLTQQVYELQNRLAEKEAELRQGQQQQLLTGEMEQRLAKAYDEFNTLRDNMGKLEGRLSQPANREFEYNELQQNYVKLTKDFDDIKSKHQCLLEENQRLSRLMADTEDKLRESNFQRQQLQKKINFLEELNQDLQQISEQNKKLENQLKRMSEIELLLARVAGKTGEESDKTAEDGNTDY